MGLNPRVTTEWLRKGRRVEDMKILRKLFDDSSDWKLTDAKLSEKLFETSYKMKPLPAIPHDSEIINDRLSQRSVTEMVRTNKNDITPTGSDLRHQVDSLLPSNMTTEEKKSMSYVLSRIVFDEILSAFKWPVIPTGLDSLSSALYTINIIAHQTGNQVRWLLPIWALKTNEYKLRYLKEILKEYDSDSNQFSIDIMDKTKKTIESFLGKDSFSGQDPLSDKIDTWRVAIVNMENSEEKLRDVRKSLSQSQKSADVESKKIKEFETEIARLEQTIWGLKRSIKKNRKDLENEIQTLRTLNQQITEWNINSLHPAGPTAVKHEYLVKNIRNELNIMSYEPLLKICELLRFTEQPGRPSATDLARELRLRQRMANYTLVRFGYILNEHYIFSPSSLDLRFRYILTKKQKPGVFGDGLVERLTMHLSDDFSGCTVHLEPTSSGGPTEDQLPKGSVQLTADSEILSMRLNLYDLKEKMWVLTSAYETDPLTKSPSLRQSPSWLYRDTGVSSQVEPHLSPMEIDIISILPVFRGLRHSRRWLFKQLGYNQVTSRRYLKQLLNRHIFRLMYLPSLEFCGLPVGLIVGGQFKTDDNRKMLMDWMTSKLPFARILTGNSTDLIAYLRLPTDAITTVRAILRETFKAEALNWFVSGVMSNQTYHMTAFHRLAKKDGNGWSDPWAD